MGTEWHTFETCRGPISNYEGGSGINEEAFGIFRINIEDLDRKGQIAGWKSLNRDQNATCLKVRGAGQLYNLQTDIKSS